MLEDDCRAPSDGSTGGIGGGNCSRIDARREHRRAARSRGPEGGAAAVLVREAKAALFLSRQLGRRLDGTAAVLPMRGRTPPGAARCGQVRADLVDIRGPEFGGVPGSARLGGSGLRDSGGRRLGRLSDGHGHGQRITEGRDPSPPWLIRWCPRSTARRAAGDRNPVPGNAGALDRSPVSRATPPR